jgi:hypothetical protein
MERRAFLAALPCAALAQRPSAQPVPLTALAEEMFLEIARGFVLAAAKTSDSYAVVEYPGATVTQNFLAKSGKSATGVTRMLPALAAWIAGRRQPGILHIEGKPYDLLDVTGSALVNGTNPAHKDYWAAAPAGTQDQRQVESSVVAWSAWLLRDTLLPQLSSEERGRLNAWLGSCAQREVRRNNWAWFTAVNIAARMALKDKFEEFSYDANFMFEDLRALDGMDAGQGWYNDDKPRQAFDYYNSWVFASHFLYWNAMVGERFPEWSKLFADRLRRYLETAPFFFGANGSHILYGRSLIYRFGVLTPLVLAYTQKLWPQDPGLLQRIVRGNLEFHQRVKSFDPAKGKLRETYSERGTVDIHESYIDGGHPYWGMQAFAMMLIPREEPFWTGPDAPLPVERTGFLQPLEAPGMVLIGHRPSGQVKMLQGKSSKTDIHYRDKYNKLVYSSHFPFNIIQRPDICPWDNALVIRDARRRRSAGRGELASSATFKDGIEIAYGIQYGAMKVSVRSTVVADGEFEIRTHRVIGPEEIDRGIELVEGSSALGLEAPDDVDHSVTDNFAIARNRRNGYLIASWRGAGWTNIASAWDFGAADTSTSNTISPQMEVNTLWVPLKSGTQVLYSVHYASPKPLPHAELHAAAAKMLARVNGMPAPVVEPARQQGRRKK